MRIIADASQSLREAVIAGELETALNQGTRAVVLVPEQYTLEAERWLSGELKGVPRLQLDIVSFNRLAHRLVDGKRGAKKTLLNRSGTLMALQRIILEHQSQLKTYGRIAGRTGFVQETESFLKELKLSGIGPERLAECSEAADTPELLAAKLNDLGMIYGAFEEWMRAGYLDDADRLKLLNDALERERYFAGAKVWFHGFRNFTQVEWALIRTIHTQSLETTFSLGMVDPESKEAVFAPVKRTLERLTELSHQEGHRTVVSCALPLEGTAIHLGNLVFGINGKDQGDKKIVIDMNRSVSPFQEVEGAAQVLLGWAQKMNWRWRDMMVATPSDPFWTEALARVCQRYGIPLYVDAKVPMSDHPLSRYVLDLIAAARTALNGEVVCRALKWGYSGVSREQAECLENHVLARGIRSYRWGYSQQAPPKVAELMQWVSEEIGTLARALTENTGTTARTEALISFLKATGVPQILEQEGATLLVKGLMKEAQVHGQVWEHLMDILQQVETLMGEESLSLESYGDIVKAGLETVEIGAIPPTGDQVSTGTLFRSRSSHVKGLLILGANEGLLPAYDSGDGILLNDEKLLLVKRGLPLESDRDTRGSEEEYALYELLGKTEERLYVSCSIKDAGGEALQASWFFEKLLLERDNKCEPNKGTTEAGPGHPAAFLSQLAELKRERIPLKQRHQSAVEQLMNRNLWRGKVEIVEAGANHRYQLPSLQNRTVEALVGKTLVLNATGLERYTQCPFSWLVRYGLKPQPRKKYAVEVPDMGTLFHLAVDRFMRVNKEVEWSSWSKEEVEQALEPIVDTLAADYGHGILEDSARTRFLKKKIQRLGIRALSTLGRQLNAGKFTVAGTELAFDMRPEKEGLPPLIVETETGNRLIVQGRIDRVDICPLDSGTHVRVIDYKSGRPRFSLSDFAHGLELQLAVYLDVLHHHGREFSTEGVQPAGFLYFYLDDPLVDTGEDGSETIEKAIFRELRMEGLLIDDLKVLSAMDVALQDSGQSAVIPVSLKKDGTPSSVSSVISKGDMASLLAYAEEIIRKNGTSILAGDFSVSPCQTEQGMACVRCDYGAICQYDPGAEESPRRVLRKMSTQKALEEITGRDSHERAVDSGTE